MPYCAVPQCPNGTSRSKIIKESVKFHCLPKDGKTAEKWWQAIKRVGSLKSVADFRVCSDHFQESDYVRDLKFELLNPGKTQDENPKRVLALEALPSVNIPSSIPCRDAVAREGLVSKRRRKELVEEAMVMDEEAAAQPDEENSQATRALSDAKHEICQLKSELAELRKTCAPTAGVKTGLFTELQAQFLISGVRPSRWDEETMLKALEVRLNTSRRQYNWLRSKGHPLPGISTLQKWLSGVVLRPNDSKLQVAMLSKMLTALAERDRQCVVMYDEMDLMGRANYDPQLDQIIGPYKHLQVIMVGGIFSKWKLPVLFCFDQAVTEKMLMDLIIDLEGAGARVVAAVSDMGSTNLGLWRQLGIHHENRTYIVHPVDPKRQIWFFADPPHVLKRLRNNILDGGVKTSRGGNLDRELMRELLAIDGSAEYKILPKLHLQTHVEVTGLARQKVRPAFELISATCALAMERYLTTGDERGRDEEARVLRIFDDLSDVFNARYTGDHKTLRRGYRGSLEQEEALEKAKEEVSRMRVGKATHLYPFQKGMLINIISLRGLLADVKTRFGADTYLLTRRLTQDRLESLFGSVRGKGGSNLNPTALEARSRLRLLLLLNVVESGVNPLRCQEEELQEEGELIQEEQQLAIDAEIVSMESDVEGTANEDVLVNIRAIAEGADEATEEDVGLEELAALLREAEKKTTVPPAAVAAESKCDRRTGVPAAQSAMAHVAGYVARKRADDRSLGAPSAYAESVPKEALWTNLLSLNGLTIPTEAFNAKFIEMDEVFCVHHALHPDGLSREEGVIGDMVSVLERKFPTMDRKVLRAFARIRTFIRMGTLNSAKRDQALARREKRKRRHFSQ